MVLSAFAYGYADTFIVGIANRHIATMGASGALDISTDEDEMLMAAADEVEAWMNENVAPDGFYFEWSDGEFFLSADDVDEDGEEDGEEDDEDEDDYAPTHFYDHGDNVARCVRHSVIVCSDPLCDPHGVFHSEMVANEVWGGTE